MDDRSVLSEIRNGIAIITLNRPDRRNAIDIPLRLALIAAIHSANHDRDTRAIVLTGAGGHFCSGGDLNSMDRRDVGAIRARMESVAELASLIRLSPKPCIAAVTGNAFGAGLSLALLCDQIVANRSSRFCAAFVKAGLTPDYGLMHLLPGRVGDGNARKLIMAACVVDATEALAMNLVDELVDEDDLIDIAVERAGQFSAHAPIAVQMVKTALGTGRTATLEASLRLETDLTAQLFQSADFTEAVSAFRERRPPRFSGE